MAAGQGVSRRQDLFPALSGGAFSTGPERTVGLPARQPMADALAELEPRLVRR